MTKDVRYLTDKIAKGGLPEADELEFLLNAPEEDIKYLTEKAVEARTAVYGKEVFIRGLIEISNYCKNDCLYCGIRRSNCKADRYRLIKDDILECCKEGYSAGFRTFVMQGGEDGYFNDDRLSDIVRSIKEKYPDCAITLSVGEKNYDSYKKLFDAGADRYLLRHETATDEHYQKLHPSVLTLENRKRCLYDLKKIGFQTGCGFMVGSPYQTCENIVEDLKFIKEFKPEMVGLGPFIPHKDTPFKEFPSGSVTHTLRLLSIVRIIHPKVLLPATTALGTAKKGGRENGILAGANVIMPNLSPVSVRKKYMLYNDKLTTDEEAAENLNMLKKSMEEIGYFITANRGDFKK